MNPKDLPKGAGASETPSNGRAANDPGVYEHAASGKQVIVMPDAQSSAQQDALVRMGYTKVAEPPTALELRAMQEAQAAKDAKKSDPATIIAAGFDPNAVRYNLTSTISEGGSTSNPLDTTVQAPSATAELEAKNEELLARIQELQANPATAPTEEATPEVETPAEDSTETQTKEESTGN
jgi:hypothetical protein